MEKVAENYYRINQVKNIKGLRLSMTIDRIDGKELDTAVEVSGSFAVCGQCRKEFLQELEVLIDKYRI